MDLWSPDAAEWWQAFAAAGTFVVAVVAAFYAARQVREARRLREEQARPYVAVYLENAVGPDLDLVVKNFGATTARNITMTSDKPMLRYWGGGEVEDLLTFDRLPTLVPGQEWRTVFDMNGARSENDDDVYTLTVASDDSRGRPLPDGQFIIDWHPHRHRLYLDRKSTHDVAEAVRQIASTIKAWSEFPRGLSVFTRDGQARDIRRAEEAQALRARRQQSRPKEPGQDKPAEGQP